MFPRFCIENIDYLDLTVNKISYDEIAVLQKCFCDIPLHMIMTNFDMILTADSQKKLANYDKQRFFEGNNHPGFYGTYGIAFSKKWCEEKNLQPVQYLNCDSMYTKDFGRLVDSMIHRKNLPNRYVGDIVQRLALIKPLRGNMKRYANYDGENVEIEVEKNFHDEQEWRFIPDLKQLTALNKKGPYRVDPVIANPNLMQLQLGPGERYLDNQSSLIQNQQYEKLWLRFNYDDIRYIIVPDSEARINIVNFIMSLPAENFDSSKLVDPKYILLSKILVLDEIRKDW